MENTLLFKGSTECKHIILSIIIFFISIMLIGTAAIRFNFSKCARTSKFVQVGKNLQNVEIGTRTQNNWYILLMVYRLSYLGDNRLAYCSQITLFLITSGHVYRTSLTHNISAMYYLRGTSNIILAKYARCQSK